MNLSFDGHHIEFYFHFVFDLNGSARDAYGIYAEVALLERCGATVVAPFEGNQHNNRLILSMQV